MLDFVGGGDPDRTGDPRLMSPLLCQLSYTATGAPKRSADDTRGWPDLSSGTSSDSSRVTRTRCSLNGYVLAFLNHHQIGQVQLLQFIQQQLFVDRLQVVDVDGNV